MPRRPAYLDEAKFAELVKEQDSVISRAQADGLAIDHRLIKRRTKLRSTGHSNGPELRISGELGGCGRENWAGAAEVLGGCGWESWAGAAGRTGRVRRESWARAAEEPGGCG